MVAPLTLEDMSLWQVVTLQFQWMHLHRDFLFSDLLIPWVLITIVSLPALFIILDRFFFGRYSSVMTTAASVAAVCYLLVLVWIELRFRTKTPERKVNKKKDVIRY